MRSRIYLKLSFVIINISILVGVGFKLIGDAKAQNTTGEMQSVMKYLGKKLSIAIAPKGTSCTGGTITDSGCNNNTCSVTTPNVTQSSVSEGSGTLTCSVGYSGSPTYTCTSGTFTPTGGNCTAITCSITGVTGLNDKTGLAYAASATAIPNTPTSACASGYTGSPTYTCTTTGAATIITNCTVSCNVTPINIVLTSGSSYTVPVGGYCHVKVWAIGGGGGGSGGGLGVASPCNGISSSGAGGSAGGVAVKTYTVTSGQIISYTIGAAGAGVSAGLVGGVGTNTSVTIGGVTIIGSGGNGGYYVCYPFVNSGIVPGGIGIGGDINSTGGTGGDAFTAQFCGAGGGGIGGASGQNAQSSSVYGGTNSDISGLFAVVDAAGGYSTACCSGFGLASAGGFGTGGGGGCGGNNGSNGLYGGGGGGNGKNGGKGGNGGQGVVVLRFGE